MKVFKSVVKDKDKLYFTTSDNEVDVDEGETTTDIPWCIWDGDFEKTFLREGEWVAPNFVLRAGVSAIVLDVYSEDNIMVILRRLKTGELSFPNYLWVSDDNLREVALKALGQKIILNQGGYVGYWLYDDIPCERVWVEKYAHDFNLINYDSGFTGLSIRDLDNDRKDGLKEGVFEIYLNNDYQGKAMLTAEFKTGLIELLLLFELCSIHDDTELKDGDFQNGWLNLSKVSWFRKGDLEGENLTPKVKKVFDLL